MTIDWRRAIATSDEWIGWDVSYCYWCGQTESEGHAVACVRAAALASDAGSVGALPLASAEVNGLDVEHPEAHCGRCGGPNPSWHAASPLWNAVMRIGESEPFDGIVCPSCFVFLAAEAGVAEYLCVTAHGTKVPLATTMGDRVWDAATCMWVAAAYDAERQGQS